MLENQKDNKQAAPKAFFFTYEEKALPKLLGNKPSKAKEEAESKSDSSKTKIHGIVFKKNENADKTVKKVTCNCKNSQCLKLYCECFAKLAFCDPEICSCKGCANTNENKESREALINLYLTKNPKTFKKRLVAINKALTASSNVDIGLNEDPVSKSFSSSLLDSLNSIPVNVEKGCTCKKSHCQKKYCECFQNGGACGPLCKCVDCKNTKTELNSPDSTRSVSYYSNKNLTTFNTNINEATVKQTNLSSEFVKTEAEPTFAFFDSKKKIIEPCKIIIKDYQLIEEQITLL